MMYRNLILAILNSIHDDLESLEELLNDKSDQELEEILMESFMQFTRNIKNNIKFQRMIIVRFIDDVQHDGKSFMTNEELETYFLEHWNLLIDDDAILSGFNARLN
jgi:hypothetical protein